MQDYHYSPNYTSMRLTGNVRRRERLSLAIKLRKMQNLSTETCFHWAILSHFRYFIITVFGHTAISATQGVSRRTWSKKTAKNCNWDCPFWREQSNPHSCTEENGRGWRDCCWSILSHPHQSNIRTGVLILITAKDRRFQRWRYTYVCYTYTSIHSPSDNTPW